MFFVFFLCFLLPRGKNYLIFTSDKCQLVLRSPSVACPGFPLPVILGLPGHLLLLQRLSRVGAHEAECLPEDGAGLSICMFNNLLKFVLYIADDLAVEEVDDALGAGCVFL